MTNIRKSFNFRNGVQVDNDKFVVSPTGRVGIGTSSPSVYLLNVFGDTRTTGLTTTRDLYVTQNVEVGGITTVGSLTASEVSVSSTVTAASFVGDGGGLTGVIASGTGLVIQDDGSPVGTGGTINFGSNISVSPASVGVVTVSVTNVTGNVNGNLTGDVTGDVTGDLTGDVTGNVTGNLTGNVNALSGISTFVEVKIGTAITMSAGIVTATTFEGNTNATKLATGTIPDARFPATLPTVSGANLTNLNGSNISSGTIPDSLFPATLPTVSGANLTNLNGSNISSGIIPDARFPATLPTVSGANLTDLNGSNISSGTIAAARVETLNQNTTGTAANLSGTPNVILGVTTTGNLSSQTITGTSITGTSITATSITGTSIIGTSIGIGTSSPANTFQQRATGATELQVTSDTASASVTIGREPGVDNTNNAEFRYGHDASGFPFSNEQSLDIVNYGTGNFNYYLSANNAFAAAGDYIWHKGANNSQLMSLTKDGNLGIGITNPTHKLDVQGISTFTDAAYFESTLETGGNLTVGGDLIFSASANITATLRGNVESGNGNSVVLTVPAGNDDPVENAEIKARVVGGASTITKLEVSGSGHSNPVFSVRTGAASTISVASDVVINVNDEAKNKFVVTSNGGIGIGTTNPENTLDMRFAERPVVFPNISTSERDDLAAPVNGGISTSSGSVIYNTTTNKLQVYTGSSWVDLH